ncbi:PREDICTED: sorting nexin-8-like [Amphimedon queenslandica]|uniref:PX domain-containing protein n=1 Tax=Amphimedon queenslandica TaxID=400682 RepID=A0A1X7VVG8_AMPQE|nr:PREDICTED: sorting nexin-8-like [Amphimedon queenslandica]|eukprot:XP_019853027.1 PREDICTED: sorting nexin-8-like [Amphimedon queenslandica]
MAGLSTGQVPQLYREVFDAVTVSNSSKIPKSLWLKVISTANITESSATEIWKMCDPGLTNMIGRDQFYKSLALTALAQLGKPLEDKVLLNYTDKELPSPSLASVNELKDIKARFVRATNPSELGYTYEDLKGFDEIKVTLIPEKKGALLKHNEYTVESKKFGSSVSRRYKDFEGFHHILSQRFPFRLVPNLPPKAISQSSEFIEQRRRALRRYLCLIARHPVLLQDEVVRYFFTASGQDVGARIKEKYKDSPDEVMFNPLAQNARELVTDQTRMKYERVKEQLSMMLKIMTAFLNIGENFEGRTRAFHEDMKAFSRELLSLSSESVLSTPWTSGSDNTWGKMQSDCRQLSDQFSTLGDRALTQAENEAKGFAEGAHLFLDLLKAYQDLCTRREKLVHRKHQKALAKVQTMEKYKGHLEAQGKVMSERQDSKQQKYDDELIIVERRNFFSLFCLDLEAQLIHVNLSQIPDMLKALVSNQMSNHQTFYKLWEEIKPTVDIMGESTAPVSSLGPTNSLRGGTRSLETSPTSKSSVPEASPFY